MTRFLAHSSWDWNWKGIIWLADIPGPLIALQRVHILCPARRAFPIKKAITPQLDWMVFSMDRRVRQVLSV